jgi:hypothetical protein
VFISESLPASACNGCAAGSTRCPATAIGRYSRGTRCATTWHRCSARWTRQALGGGSSDDPATLVSEWEARNKVPLERVARIMGELRAVPAPDVAMVSVALRELRNLG